MKPSGFGLILTAAMLCASPVVGQQPSVTIHDDDITIRGCVSSRNSQPADIPSMLVWSRSDIMLAGATALDGRAPASFGENGLTGRVFYWLENDEDLAKHVGQMVEIKGDLKDFEKGQIDVKRDGAFTEMKLELGGKEEKVRVPTSWLGPASSHDDHQEFDILGQKVDVDDIKVLGACNRF